ncbi:hypothetical protein PRIPAC_96698 [Pristionchus pacificus]|uniref:Uncharacterized protein n=1 Tax=Pristionchus pacificus TaxID=54126 RepID=A0A2A6CTM1_PRIPA|nr:hypothetical protein PRIPAC_96698 [Pristionchus pacificus]|eukprot:PDM81574.1 hypothetical protein PRIPAC_30555 [Pristionchus pacificus]
MRSIIRSSIDMKTICLLLSAPLLILSQSSYGVPNDSPSTGYGPASVAAAPVFPFYDQARHDILRSPRRHHHHHRGSSSSSESREAPYPRECRKLKSKCNRDDENCCKAIIKNDVIKCKGNPGEFVQLQDGEGNLIDYGFGEVEVDAKCEDRRWRVRNFEDKKKKVKSVVCYHFALPAIVEMSSFETPRTTPFDLDTFFDHSRVSDAINWSAAVFTNDKSLLDDKEVQKSLTNLDNAVFKTTP